MNLFRFAIATALATWILLIVGGMVNPAGASLACPDWPLCYGSLFPEMKNGVEFEHTHRLVATLVGLMSIVLAIWIWRDRPEDGAARWLGVLALVLVVFQGVLGGITVLLKLPTIVSTSHLALSMVFFGLVIYLCFHLWPGKTKTSSTPTTAQRTAVAWALGLVYVQILLGAVMRHTGAGRACGTDWMLCVGSLWPDFGPGQVHMAHRLVGYLAFVAVVVASVTAVRQARRHEKRLARLAAIAAPIIALLQILLGIHTVATAVGVSAAAAHLGGGALLMADLLVVYLALGPQVDRAWSGAS